VKNRLWLTLVGTVVLLAMATMSTTGAFWSDEAIVDAGTVSTGSLVLLVGGDPEVYVFDALNAVNLAPGHSVRAPLTISNGGSTDMNYGLASVATTAQSAADQELSAALLLTITVATDCGETPPTGERLVDHVPLNSAPAFSGRVLTPSASEALCIEIALGPDAPAAAASGTTSVSFTFRGDQRF
jgi:hypothetical protein